MTENSDDALKRLDDVLGRMQRAMHVHSLVKQFGLTTSQVYILRYLGKCSSAKSSDIARMVGLSPGAVTQVCDELVRLKLIERLRSEADRRVVNVSLTPQGHDKIDQMMQMRGKGLKKIMGQLGTDDVNEMIRILNRVVDVIEEPAQQ